MELYVRCTGNNEYHDGAFKISTRTDQKCKDREQVSDTSHKQSNGISKATVKWNIKSHKQSNGISKATNSQVEYQKPQTVKWNTKN